MTVTTRVEGLVRALVELPALPHTFNPYRDACQTYDLADAASIRRDNLSALLRRAATCRTIDLWIGREPGHLGARRTGVALIDEARLPAYAAIMDVPLRRATHTDARRKEPTGGAVGDALEMIRRPTLLWNICPLHSHKPGIPLSNNEHTRAATLLGRPLLEGILDLIQPRSVLALGNRAHEELRSLDVQSIKLTHPAARGEKRRLFPQEVREHYRLTYNRARSLAVAETHDLAATAGAHCPASPVLGHP